MYGVIFLRGICASELEDYFGTAGVVGNKVGDIVDVAVEYYPTAFCSIVFGYYPGLLAIKLLFS
jgi:hypothetical protein